MPGLLFSGPRPLIVAHRGASAVAPENTLAAFRAAVELGADAIELDVQRTADGHVIIMHDPMLDRTTNGRGPVADRSLRSIKALDAGSWFGPAFAGERVPTLEEAVNLVGGRLGLLVEIKQGPRFDETVEAAVVQVLQQRPGAYEVSSFDHFSVLRTKALAPELPCGILFEARLIDPFGAAALARADALHLYWTLITPDFVPEAHRRGHMVVAWTVNDEEAMTRLADSGVDAIVTDRPDLLRRVLGR